MEPWAQIRNQDNMMDPSLISWEGNFDTQVEKILNHVRLTIEDVLIVQRLCKDLQDTLYELAPGCKVHPFGSVLTGLGIKTSDVDCYIQLPSGMEPTRQFVIYARNVLRQHYTLFANLFAIPHASVPIVKLYHKPTNFNCDINFVSAAGVHNSNLIKNMLCLDSRVLPLAVLLKYYSKIYKFTGTNLLTSYTLILMVIFYFQQIQVLPPVWELQRQIPERMIDGWNNAFDDNYYFQQEILNNDSLYDLLGGFFKYYLHFNYYENMISPFLGRVIKKQAFVELSTVPDEFSLYKYNVANEICKPLKVDSKICVQDPFQHNRNCSGSLSHKLADNILAHFKFAAQKFESVSSNDFLQTIFMDSNVPELKNKHSNKNKKKPVLHHRIRKHTPNPRHARFAQMNNRYVRYV